MRPFYPALIAAHSVLYLWLGNIVESSSRDALGVLAGVLLGTVLLQFVATKWMGSRDRGAAVAAISVFLLLNYGHA